jgi:O-antigen/teichoic acid export membrane protein
VGIATGSLVALMFRVSDVFLWGFIGVLTARTLTVEDRGVYATAIVVTSAIGGVSSLSSATGYFVSNQKKTPAEVAANALTLIVPIVAVIVLFAGGTWLLFDGSDGRIVALATLSMAPAIFRNTSLGVILGEGHVVKYNFGGDITVIFAMIFLTAWVGVLDHRTAEGALQAWTAAQFASLVPFLVWGRSWWAWALRHRPSFGLMRAMLRFTAVTGAGSIVGLLNYRIDQALVIGLDSREGAGIYSSAIAVAEGLWLFSSAITVAAFAHVGRASREEAAHITATGIRHTVMVVMCGGLAAALLGPILVEFLFGHAYRNAGAPLRILCLGTALSAPLGLMNLYYVNQLGRPRLPLLIGILSFIISLVAGFALIPTLGTSGAALATTISYGVATSVSTVVFLRLTGLRFHELWRIQWSDIRAYFELAGHVLEGVFETGQRAWRRVVPVRAG